VGGIIGLFYFEELFPTAKKPLGLSNLCLFGLGTF